MVLPTDADYDGARRIWNASIDRHPGLIVRCSGAADVVHAVKFARANDLLVAVRGGGHNVGGRALCDDGIVIDLSAMQGVFVDPDRRTARVQGGATLGDVDRETHLLRPRGAGGRRLPDRDRRPDAGRRRRLAGPEVRSDLRQRAVLRGRHGRGQAR